MKRQLPLYTLAAAIFTCLLMVNAGFPAPGSHGPGTAVTPMALLHDLKNGTKTRDQLKTALVRYMKQEAEQTDDPVTWYTPEARRYKDIVAYVGFEKNWAIINRRSLIVLKDTLQKLENPDSAVRLKGLDNLTNFMLALQIISTPQKNQMMALRLLIGQLYFFPSLYFKEANNLPYLPERMLRTGFFHAAEFFDLGKEFYPLGIEAYKHLLKTHATRPTDQSHYMYWISWGYLQLEQYDEAIAWAKKMPYCIGMTEAPARLQKWARQGKAKKKKAKR